MSVIYFVFKYLKVQPKQFGADVVNVVRSKLIEKNMRPIGQTLYQRIEDCHRKALESNAVYPVTHRSNTGFFRELYLKYIYL